MVQVTAVVNDLTPAGVVPTLGASFQVQLVYVGVTTGGIVTEQPFTVPIVGGVASFTVPPTSTGNAYRISATRVTGFERVFVTVPNGSAYTLSDLILNHSVDPLTLGPQVTPLAAWVADLSTESAARAAGDASNFAAIGNTSTALANEGATRAAADATLTTNVAANSAAIAAEVTSRASAVTAEAAARTAGDATNASSIAANTTAIGNEVTARVAGDTTNATAITNETNARITGDATNATAITANTTAITNEASTRALADTTETNARTAGDATNAAAISANTTAIGLRALVTDLTAETSRATSAEALKAPIASPTFTGTVSGVTKSMVGLPNVDNTADTAKPVSTAQAAADTAVRAFAIQRANHTGTQTTATIVGLDASLAAKADLVGGVIPSAQIPSIALVTAVPVASQSAMLALTSSQVQPGDLAIRSDGAGTFILLAADPSVLGNWTRLNAPTDVVVSVNGQVGTVLLGKADVGLGSVDNTSDLNKPLSTADQNALALKAPLASPTFTGTVSGVSKSMVGLENVDNTSDAAKPVSTATQTALDAEVTARSSAVTTEATTRANADSVRVAVDAAQTFTTAQRLQGRSNIHAVSHTQAAKNPDMLIVGAITRDANDVITSAAVVWPDGSPGTFTTNAIDVSNAINGYSITYGSPVTQTFTQPTITRSTTGAATNVPQIVVT